jgi:uncharacterized protein (TIGR00725 family)
MKTTIGVMGASVISDPKVESLSEELGVLIAQNGATLITGAGIGLPLAAARGAHKAGGEVIGFSPAISRTEHIHLGLPIDNFDLIVFTGLSSNGRNLLNVRSCNGLIFIGGSIGALNEFTIAYAENKVIGVVEGTGGFCDHMREWIRCFDKPTSRAVVHYSTTPAELIPLIFDSIRKQTAE